MSEYLNIFFIKGNPFAVRMKRTGLLLLVFFSLLSCTRRNDVPYYYYLVHPLLVGDGERPTAPQNLDYEYYVVDGVLNIHWDPGHDNQLQIPPLYRVYIYETSPPVEYYREENLQIETGDTSLYSPMTEDWNTFYLTVTTFDGTMESYPAPYITVNPLDASKWRTLTP